MLSLKFEFTFQAALFVFRIIFRKLFQKILHNPPFIFLPDPRELANENGARGFIVDDIDSGTGRRGCSLLERVKKSNKLQFPFCMVLSIAIQTKSSRIENFELKIFKLNCNIKKDFKRFSSGGFPVLGLLFNLKFPALSLAHI